MMYMAGNQHNRTDYSVVGWNHVFNGKTSLERFWSKVAKIDDEFSCWEWIGNKTLDGYGRFRPYGLSSDRHAHSISYYLAYGNIPVGHGICHTCDNRSCVRPSHLFACTHAENMKDMKNKGRYGIPRLKGSEHGGAKLTEQDVLFIRQEASEVKSRKENVQLKRKLGQQFDVDPKHIQQIISKRRWRHI